MGAVAHVDSAPAPGSRTSGACACAPASRRAPCPARPSLAGGSPPRLSGSQSRRCPPCPAHVPGMSQAGMIATTLARRSGARGQSACACRRSHGCSCSRSCEGMARQLPTSAAGPTCPAWAHQRHRPGLGRGSGVLPLLVAARPLCGLLLDHRRPCQPLQARILGHINAQVDGRQRLAGRLARAQAACSPRLRIARLHAASEPRAGCPRATGASPAIARVLRGAACSLTQSACHRVWQRGADRCMQVAP